MSTLQHISRRTLNWRIGRRMVVAMVVAVVAAAALTIALVNSSGGASGSAQSASPPAISQQLANGEPKYLATHRRPAPETAVGGGQSLRTDSVYAAKH